MSKRNFDALSKPKFATPIAQATQPPQARQAHNPALDILKHAFRSPAHIPTQSIPNQQAPLAQQNLNPGRPQQFDVNQYQAMPNGEHFEITEGAGMKSAGDVPQGNVGPDAQSTRLMNHLNYRSRGFNIKQLAQGKPELAPDLEKYETSNPKDGDKEKD
jgi:hypothetical protein